MRAAGGQGFQPVDAGQRNVAHGRQEFKRQGGQGLAQAQKHFQFKAFDVDLHEVGASVAGDQRVQRVHGHGGPGCPLHPAERCRGTGAAGEVGRQGGHGGGARAGQQLRLAGCAPQRQRQHADLGVAAEAALQQAHEVGLRLDRDHPCAQATKGVHPVTGMRADVEGQATGRHEGPVEAAQLSAAPGDAAVDQQRTQHADLAVQLLAQPGCCVHISTRVHHFSS